MIDDWYTWMKQHHIHLRGDPDDSRENAAGAERSLSRKSVADESKRDGRPPGCRDLQMYGSRGKVISSRTEEEKRTRNQEGNTDLHV